MTASTDRILAAGGLLWRHGDDGPEIAVVYRPRHRDVCLPKGKLRSDETFAEAALREVEEETGYRAELSEFAGEMLYRAGGSRKSVLYWHMRCVGDSPLRAPDPEEVAQVRVLAPDRAVAELSYDNERSLVLEALRDRDSSRS